MTDFPNAADVTLGVFFGVLTASQLILMVASVIALQRAKQERYIDMGSELLEPTRLPPVALIVPAFNEEATIVDSVRALIQIDYPALQIVVVNDGGQDQTMKALKEAFSLRHAEIASEGRLSHQPIQGTYTSRSQPRLRVIDKLNGGKADALNAGIEHTLCSLVCCIDADTIIERQSITRMVEPFLTTHPPPVAVGGTIQIANDSEFSGGHLARRRHPKSWLARCQALEYMRAFLFFRLPLARWNGNPIISGALGMFRRSALLEVGGYETRTVGEDMELVVRLHRHFIENDRPYSILFRSDAVAYTECPEDLTTLVGQRDRWQRGLLETLVRHRSLSFHRRSSFLGWCVLPYFWLFEIAGPFVEALATIWWIWGAASGRIPLHYIGLMLLVAVSFNLLFSLHTLLLDDLDGALVTDQGKLLVLATALVEPFYHRPVVAWARIRGTWKYLRGDGSWGRMNRQGFKTEGSLP